MVTNPECRLSFVAWGQGDPRTLQSQAHWLASRVVLVGQHQTTYPKALHHLQGGQPLSVGSHPKPQCQSQTNA